MKILYEDNHIIVTIKPPGVPVQGDKTGDDDMLSVVKRYVAEKYHKPGEAYIGLVHRIDRPVGGVVAFARTSKAAARLSEQVRAHTMRREYLAVVDGDMPEQGVLVDYLAKDELRGVARIVTESDKRGKRAELSFEMLAIANGLTLLRVTLQTGRFHQIRAQLSNAGHPIYGDVKYGGERRETLALWGYRLTLVHPTLKKEMCFVGLPERIHPWDGFEGDVWRVLPS